MMKRTCGSSDVGDALHQDTFVTCHVGAAEAGTGSSWTTWRGRLAWAEKAAVPDDDGAVLIVPVTGPLVVGREPRGSLPRPARAVDRPHDLRPGAVGGPRQLGIIPSVSYRGGSLLDLLGSANTAEPTRHAMREITHRAGEAMTHAAAANTPRRTGRTAEAWKTIPVTEVPDGYESGTYNERPQARWLEHGTDPHDISPRKKRALNTPGGPRDVVHHPGTEGTHALARAGEEVEAALGELAAPALREWAAKIERGASR